MSCWGIITAAGQGSRLALPEETLPKQFFMWQGVPLFWHCALAFAAVARLRGLVFVFPEAHLETAQGLLTTLDHGGQLGLPYLCTVGGKLRQDSVRLGLKLVPTSCDTVLVHDAARPFLRPELILRVLTALDAGHEGVIPVLPLKDTVKTLDAARFVQATLPREELCCVQTPQGFKRTVLEHVHRQACTHDWTVTDDASLLERCHIPVFTVLGDEQNCKITTMPDRTLLEDTVSHNSFPSCYPCTGFGYDVHRYGGDRPLILGGIPLEGEWKVSAHSDGDVLTHALMDAILGCLGAGDIGKLFPDTDPALDGISSCLLLAEVMELARSKEFSLQHADVTIVAQAPRITPHRERIQKNLAAMLGLPLERVNVKATTEEKLGFTGEKKGIKAYAVVSGFMPI